MEYLEQKRLEENFPNTLLELISHGEWSWGANTNRDSEGVRYEHSLPDYVKACHYCRAWHNWDNKYCKAGTHEPDCLYLKYENELKMIVTEKEKKEGK